MAYRVRADRHAEKYKLRDLRSFQMVSFTLRTLTVQLYLISYVQKKGSFQQLLQKSENNVLFHVVFRRFLFQKPRIGL